MLSSLVAQQSALFYHLSTQDGLKDIQQNNFIYKDSKGYLWVSSLSSLERFDGDKFISYPTNSNAPTGIKGKYIQGNFFEDKATNLWFATFEAIIKYNRDTDKFTSYQLVNSTLDTINKNYHIFYFDRKKQELWVLADSELYIFPIDATSSYNKLPLRTKSLRFTFLEFSENKKLLFGTPWLVDSGIEFITQKGNNWNIQYIPLLELGSPKISQILVSEKKEVWFLSNVGLIKFNKKNPKESQLFNLGEGQNSSFRNGVFVDDNIILSSDDGLYFFNILTETFINQISTQSHKDNGLKVNLSKELYLDGEKELWIANHNFGISHMSLKGQKDFYFINPSLKSEKTPIVKIVANKNKIILATGNDGLFSLEKKNEFKFQKQNHWLPNRPLFDLVVDSQNNVWASLLKLYILKNNIKIPIEQPEDFKVIFLLPLKDRMIGTSLKGLNGIRKTGSSFKFDVNISPNQQLYSRIFKKSTGEILASTYTNHLDILEEQQDSIIKKLEIDTQADVLAFFENTTNANIWCGTNNGLAVLNNKNNFKYLLEKEWEIGKTDVYSIIEDDKERLWIGAGNGFWYYNLKTKNLIRFRPENGLGNVVFMPNAQHKASDGTLWFGTNKGALFFHPDSIMIPKKSPKIQINGLKINDKPFKGKKVIGELENLNLKYTENSLEFNVVSLDYQLPKYNQIRYRLKGYDKDWKLIKSGAPIRYTKIPFGQTYELEVIGINAHQVESLPKRLTIVIRLPYWQTWWFLVLVLTGGMAFSFIVAKLYHRKKERERKRKEERKAALIQQKREISNDLHDDIGNDLSQIMSMSELASLKNNDTRIDVLKEIEDLAADSIKNLRYTMWSLDIEEIKLSSLLFKVREYAQSYLRRNQLKCTFILPEDIPNIKIDGQIPREVFLITKECLSNIKKYAEADEVIITIKNENPLLIIEIKDDGIGFNFKEKIGKGKGLTTMNNRAKRLKGSLTIKSSPDKGTIVILNVPLVKFDN